MSNPPKRPSPITIGDYTIDASLTETHTFESEVTEFPVEQGSAISDNIRPKPIVVVIEGIVSDTPIGKIADLRNSEGDAGGLDYLPSIDALSYLMLVRDNRQPVPITSSLKRFENMVLTNLEVPRDAKTGAALRFTATFQQVTIVTNQRTTVRVVDKRTASPTGKPKKNKGKWATKTGIDGVFVITWPVASRATVTKSFGPPILTDSFGDHYRIQDNWDTKPDGYIGSDNKYHPFNAGTGSSTNIGSTINGHPVHFDYGTRNADGTYTPSGGSWVDDQSNQVTKTVPPGADRWNYVDSPFGPAKF